MTDPSKEVKPSGDVWSQWLLGRRHGGDLQQQSVILAAVERYRDRVLDGARLGPGMTLLDVGTGDGLIALGALARIGPALRVILTDLSPPLLQRAEQLARQRGVRGQCQFIPGSAENLAGIANAVVDVATTRAVLAYVSDKRAALRELRRVLKPGGRISLCEPVFQDDAFETAALTKLVEAQPAHPEIAFLRLLQRWKAAQFPATEKAISESPITNYSERDLVRLAREAGFVGIHLELHIDHVPLGYTRWDFFLDTAPHPWAPTLREVLTARFAEPERAYFERVMRPRVESGNMLTTEAIAYLTAEVPSV
jgi:ubiquinone/menaquinone biosynthesis C-methylase UbiE